MELNKRNEANQDAQMVGGFAINASMVEKVNEEDEANASIEDYAE